MRIAIITNIIPKYREAFYQRIFMDSRINVKVFCQNEVEGLDIPTCHKNFGERVELVKFKSLPGEKLAWQKLPILTLLNEFDFIVFYGNPRVLSNVFWASLFRFLNKDVAIWGQAHTAGASSLMEKVRLFWWRLFKNIFVYNDKEVEYLKNNGFTQKNIIGMNNGLDQGRIEIVRRSWSDFKLSEWKKKENLEDFTVLLSCARLVQKNNFSLMLDSLAILRDRGVNLVWCMIGSGPEEYTLKNKSAELGLNNIRWLGSIYSEEDLAPWFLSAFLFVHPDAIGLSLLHAFGYSLPVVTHSSPKNHMPEFAAMREGKTGLLFRRNSEKDLAEKIEFAVNNPDLINVMKHNAHEVAALEYNVDVMHKRFINFVKNGVSV